MKKRILIISPKNDYSRNILLRETLKKRYHLSIFYFQGNFFLKNFRLISIIFLKFDLILIQWPLWSSFFTINFLNFFMKKPIVYDAFTLISEDYDDDRESKNSIVRSFYHCLEKYILRTCSALITDTKYHKSKIIKIRLNNDNVEIIEVSQKNLINTNKINTKPKINLIHSGANKKLHNITGIINLINDLPKKIKGKIKLNIVGWDYFDNHKKLIKKYNLENNISWVDRPSYKKLINLLKKSDIALGVFGNTIKTENIITNFMVSSCNLGKVIITKNTKAAKYYLGNNKGIFLLKKPTKFFFKKFLNKYINSIEFRKKINGESKKVFNKNFNSLDKERKMLSFFYKICN